MKYGCSSEVGEIKCLLLKHPREAFIKQESIEEQWMDLNYMGRPDFKSTKISWLYSKNLFLRFIFCPKTQTLAWIPSTSTIR